MAIKWSVETLSKAPRMILNTAKAEVGFGESPIGKGGEMLTL